MRAPGRPAQAGPRSGAGLPGARGGCRGGQAPPDRESKLTKSVCIIAPYGIEVAKPCRDDTLPAEQLQSIDEDIAELTRQRELAYSELRRYRSDPQVEARRAARARYLGEAVLAVPLDAAVVRRARELAGDDAWLFEPNILAEDGVECAPEEKGGG